MNVLVLDKLAERYKKAISEKFPELVIHAATNEEEVGEFIDQADVLMCARISDGLMQKASKLQWVQAVTTGTDYITRLPSLKKSVIITTTRGIHAPQVSEMVILLMLALNRDLAEVVRNQDRALWVQRPSRSWPPGPRSSRCVLGDSSVGLCLANPWERKGRAR